MILYGRASFDSRQRLQGIVDRLRAGAPSRQVACAFADLSGPSLPEVLGRLADSGIAEAVVVPCMIPTDPSIATWLPGALSAWRSERSTAPRVTIAAAVECFVDLADLAARSLESADAADVGGAAPSMGKPGWSEIPRHGRQIFFCTGARCLHRGAEPLYQRLRDLMRREHGLVRGPRRVLCARSSCQFPCNLGPVMTVHPDGVWYGRLDPQALDRIVAEHLIGDEIVQDFCIRDLD
ncbi:CbiX/SirB N-terminal domain-containing protein [Methylopila henanensis]|uniref:CbiX/SirB N-terminal domain-containing protein n=1 Tax=Methylopila henanensis TaxID=873516 RepID=A0ABW4K8K3_9HYPH